MTPVTLSNLVAYCAQVLCLAVGAGLLLSALRVDTPRLRYMCLRATLAFCLLLPWIQARHSPLQSPVVATTAVVATVTRVAESASVPPVTGVDWTRVIPLVLSAGATARLLWVGVGFLRLRRLRRAGQPAADGDHAELQRAVGTHAEVRYLAGGGQPVTFGLWCPVVLLPEALREQPADIREAVLAHELLHVRRRDWAWVLAEEIVRAVYWFHPAMWWLISRVQLAREEVVDVLAVAQTGRRRAYVQALLAFADGMPLAHAPAFARRRHLFHRMVLVSREDVMTSRRHVASAVTMLVMMTIGGWYAVAAFPLLEPAAGQVLQKEPGPFERMANPISPENPVPRRLYHEPPEYPEEAADTNARVTVTLKLTVDAAGNVAEARVTGLSLKTDEMSVSFSDGSVTMKGGVGPSASVATNLYQFLDNATIRVRPGATAEPLGLRARPIIDAIVNAAANAVQRWRYDAPVNAPVSFDTTFYFAPGALATDTPAATAPDDRFRGAARVGSSVLPPRKLKDVRPVYPADAKDARVQGVVIVEARIDPEGRVSEARVLRSIPMLDQAALNAVRQWEFTSTSINGVPTAVIMTLVVNFRLD